MSDLLNQEPWSKDDTETYLTANPLAAEFRWNGKIVAPQHRTLKKGYGFWLRTTPYHPGLFEEIHRILVNADPLPTADELAQRLTKPEKTEEFI